MNETIAIVGSIEATVAATLLITAKIIVLFFCIMHTFIFIRNAAHFAGALAHPEMRVPDFPAKLVYLPSVLWVIFYILTILTPFI